jgi:hypothetical protein
MVRHVVLQSLAVGLLWEIIMKSRDYVLVLMGVFIFLHLNNLFAGSCGASTSNTVTAIPFDYYITMNKGRWITMSATSDDIEWNPLHLGWPKRYKAFKYGGGAAIKQWRLDTVPGNGTLYEGGAKLSEGDLITDPDELYYKPNKGFVGEDPFGYCVSDSSGTSTVAEISMHVVDASSYPMPLGVPVPSFGIDEEPPADPPQWPGSEAAGYYYIDSDDPNCDDGNAYGWPAVPRCSLKYNAVVDAGKKMVLADSTKPYPVRSGVSWDQIYLNGTASNPAWLVGNESDPIKPRITLGSGETKQELRIQGTGNYRISGLDFDGVHPSNRGSGDNIVIRYTRIRNYASTAGGGTTVGLGGGGTNVMAFHVNANDNGIVDSTLTEERDIHAFVGTNQTNFWMIDIMCSENAGDCVQLTNNNTTKNVYVGRAVMHSMMENCTDYKDFNNFVVSESACWDIRGVSYSGGSGGGAQNFYVNDEGVQVGYGYFLNNRSWDTSGSNFGAANIGGRVYFIGNRAFFSPQAVGLSSFNGGGERHYYLNTVVNVKDGMNLYTSGSPIRYVAANVVSEVGRYNALTTANYSEIDVMDYNTYDPSGAFAWGSNSTPQTGDYNDFISSTKFDDNSTLNSELGFVNPSRFDFRLLSTSTLKDKISSTIRSTDLKALDNLKTDLGIEYRDYNGTARPDSLLDIGADEYSTMLPPPSAPTLISK